MVKKNIIKDRDKIGFVFVVFIVLFLMVLSKAFYVQIVIKKKLMVYANNQLIREDVIYPKRGNIFDRNGSPLAINIQTYSIFTIPRADNKKEQLENYRALAKIVPKLNFSEIKKRVSHRTKYTWLARKIKLTEEQVKRIESLEDVYIISEPSRFYPNHELAAQILGFVGVDNTGLSGIEFRYDKLLKGNARVIKYLKDAKGRPVKFEVNKEEEQAFDLNLSIEKDLQAVAESYLKEAVIKHKAHKGGIGVMDVHTGEILAMANYPSFDPNTPFMGAGVGDFQRSSFVSDPFEPGSSFKIFTVISALENKIARSDTAYYCERGKLKVGDHIISEAESFETFEWLTVSEILEKSSNVGITKLAFDVTYPILRRTLKQFLMGEKTGIEVPGESRGIFPTKENLDPLSFSNVSFGQGIAVTGIQMLAAYAAVANGGYYVRPTIMKVEDASKVHKVRVMRGDVAKNVTNMLIAAVEKGTGQNARIDHFKIAGKTATAQRPGKNGGYDGYLAGFVGMTVQSKRDVVAFVYIDAPKGGDYYGNVVAAPVFKDVVKYLLYENKPPLKVAKADENGVNKNANNDNTLLAKIMKLNGENDALAKINEAIEEEGQKSLESRLQGENNIPNFIGLDKISASILAKQAGLVIDSKGIGIVVSQKAMAEEKKVELIYAPPKYE
ncbi:MAG: penicillin-binding protein 2 [Oligoflexia bacterium]|nr:penicillin-binding protein 2 [Oligoflexia bacterium]MBF0364807.1 penicillin-binding protein 2 [Oligoflexia bacterium]